MTPLTPVLPAAVLGPAAVGAVFPPVQFDEPSLEAIHAARPGETEVLEAFEDARRLPTGLRRGLESLWFQFDLLAAEARRHWRAYPEYHDPSNPLLLHRHAAEVADIPSRNLKTLVPLHFQIRSSLAGEQSFDAVLRDGRTYRVSYRLVRNGFPVRDGVVAVGLDAIEETLVFFESGVRPLTDEEKPFLREGLVRMEAARGFQDMRGWTAMADGPRLARRVAPAAEEGRQALLAIVHAVLVRNARGETGDEAFAGLTSEGGYRAFLQAAAGVLGCTVQDLVVQVLGRSHERWKPGGEDRLRHVEWMIPVFNLAAVKRPAPILHTLFREELDWAFPPRRRAGGTRVYDISPDFDPSRLATMGFGPLVTAARLERRWNLPELAERSAPARRRGMATSLLGDVSANRRPPDFEILRAVVEAFNQDPSAAPVDRGTAFLAAHPTFLGLLPVRLMDTKALLPRPAGPFRAAPYADPIEGQTPMVDVKNDASARLDPAGFPALLRKYRGLRNLSVVAAAKRLGFAHNHLRRLEKDPVEGARDVPGREVVRAACHADGLKIPLEEALQARLASYWPDDPAQKLLAERTFGGPVYRDDADNDVLNGYAALPFRTPGEILYGWRNAGEVRTDAGRASLLPTRRQMARLLKVADLRYKRWEANMAVPSNEEIERMARVLNRPAGDRDRLLEAAERLREHLLARGEAAADLDDFADAPALRRVIGLLGTGAFFKPADRRRLLRKLRYFREKDPASFTYLETAATRDGNQERDGLMRLVAVIHRTEERLRTWPRRIKRQGAVAAAYDRDYGRNPEALERLTACLQRRGTRGVAFHADGAFDVVSVEARPPFDPTRAEFKGVDRKRLKSPDRRLFSDLFRFLMQNRLVGSRKESSQLARRIRVLAEHDALSYGDFRAAVRAARAADGTWERKEWARLRQILASAAHFVSKWNGTVVWEGSLFEFYAELKGDKNRAMYFHNRMNRGGVARIVFEGAHASFESVPAPRAAPAAPAPSYREASPRFLPGPANGWGEADFRLVEAELLVRLRTATGEEKSHLETLLSVAADLRREPDRGPYRDEGRLIRYYRLLHGIRLADLGSVFRGGLGVEGASHAELGRLAVAGRVSLESIAEIIGVPRAIRPAFVDHLHAAYEAKRRVLSPAEEPVEDFPNDFWAIPFAGRTEEDLQSLLRAAATAARGGLSRGDLERKTGLTPSHVHKAETQGEVSGAAFVLYEKHLGRRKAAGVLRRLRVLRAALDLARKPVDGSAGHHRAGRLLRFARLLVPDWPIRQTVADLGLVVDPTAYTRWEMGLTVMPVEVRHALGSALVARGALPKERLEEFLSSLNHLYAG